MSDRTTIRPLTPDDIPFGMALKDRAGWNQLPADWQRMIDCEPQGCFLAEWDGEPAGTAVGITYGARFGWVGMVLVRQDRRRRGIGTALLHRAIAYVEGRCAAVKLDATVEGKKLYDTLGFGDEYMSYRLGGRGRAATVDTVREIGPDGWAAEALDAEAFGADRGRIVRALMRDGRSFAVTGREDRGYAVIFPGKLAWHLGPVVAAEPVIAEALISAALATVPDEPVFLDLVEPNRDAAALAEQFGFVRRREWIRMVRGPNDWPGRPEWVYGVSGPAKG